MFLDTTRRFSQWSPIRSISLKLLRSSDTSRRSALDILFCEVTLRRKLLSELSHLSMKSSFSSSFAASSSLYSDMSFLAISKFSLIQSAMANITFLAWDIAIAGVAMSLGSRVASSLSILDSSSSLMIFPVIFATWLENGRRIKLVMKLNIKCTFAILPRFTTLAIKGISMNSWRP